MLDAPSNRYYQPFTMFWPTDKAVSRIPADIKQRIVSGNYTDQLRSMLKYHMISKIKVGLLRVKYCSKPKSFSKG